MNLIRIHFAVIPNNPLLRTGIDNLANHRVDMLCVDNIHQLTVHADRQFINHGRIYKCTLCNVQAGFFQFSRHVVPTCGSDEIRFCHVTNIC